MPGDQKVTESLEMLRNEHLDFMAKMPSIVALVQCDDHAAKRHLVEWLFGRIETAPRPEVLVSVLAFACVAPVLNPDEWRRVIEFAKNSYQDAGAVRRDDPLLQLALNATAPQRSVLMNELLTLLPDNSLQSRRTAAIEALTQLCVSSEDDEEFARFDTAVSEKLEGKELASFRQALLDGRPKRRKAPKP